MKKIVISGMPRSGTTYLGDVIARSNKLANIHEPFNLDCGLDEVKDKYPCDSFFKKNLYLLESIFSLEITFNKSPLYPNDSLLQRLLRSIIGTRGQFNLALARRNKKKNGGVLIKDPICIFGLKVISSQNLKVIALRRNVRGFIASIIKLKWRFDIEDILTRIDMLLSKNILKVYQDGRIQGQKDLGSLVYDAIFFWFIADSYINSLKNRENVLVISHEDLLSKKSLTLDKIQLFLMLENKIETEEKKFSNPIKGIFNLNILGVQNFKRSSSKIKSIEGEYIDDKTFNKINMTLSAIEDQISMENVQGGAN